MNRIDKKTLERMLLDASSMSNVLELNGKMVRSGFVLDMLKTKMSKKERQLVELENHEKKQLIVALEMELDKV